LNQSFSFSILGTCMINLKVLEKPTNLSILLLVVPHSRKRYLNLSQEDWRKGMGKKYVMFHITSNRSKLKLIWYICPNSCYECKSIYLLMWDLFYGRFHWVLMVIDCSSMTIFWLDSLHTLPDEQTKFYMNAWVIYNL